MKFLALEIENEGFRKEDFQPFLVKEAEEVWLLYKQGFIREIYFDDDNSTAVIILECNDKNDVVNVLNELPLVKNGLIHFEVRALSPYTGFSRLMNKNQKNS